MAEDPRELASELEVEEAADPSVGAGDRVTAPWEGPKSGLLEREPVRVVGAAQAIVAAAVAFVAFGAPGWAALAVAVGLYVFEEYKRLRVTPVACPQLDGGVALTPEVVDGEKGE